MSRATRIRRTSRAVPLAVAALLCLTTLVVAKPSQRVADWGEPQPVVNDGGVPADARVNTASQDGCPIESPSGLQLFIASPRPGTMGKNDIWVAERPNKEAAWGPMVNLGAPVNSAYHDFCPTPLVGGWLLFVSDRPACGADPNTVAPAPPIGDMYIVRQRGNGTWTAPQHLGCAPNGPNFVGGEFGPSLVHTKGGTYLYFSSTGTTGQHDIYRSRLTGRTFGAAEAVAELNSPAVDQMPNLSRGGTEIVFASSRVGGNMDIWTSTFDRSTNRWSTPIAVDAVNTPAPETRPSLSRDGERLYFGRGTPADVYVSTRHHRRDR